MSFNHGYINKSAYTACEHLNEKGVVVKPTSPSSDVYSFGMVLWELFTEKIPFEDMSLKEIKKIVVE